MRLNQEDVRAKFIDNLEAVAQNVRHLPWGKDKAEIHSYLLTVAHINALDPLANNYQGIPLNEWEIFVPIAELAIIPSKVTVMEDEEALNLINTAIYANSDQYYGVYEMVKQTDTVQDENGQQKIVTKEVSKRVETKKREVMDVIRFNRFSRALCSAYRANSSSNVKPVTDYRKKELLANVCRREVVNESMLIGDAMPLWLNTTSFELYAYGRNVELVEQNLISKHLSAWMDKRNN